MCIFVYIIPQLIRICIVILFWLREFSPNASEKFSGSDLLVSPICITFNDISTRTIRVDDARPAINSRLEGRYAKLCNKHVHTNTGAGRPADVYVGVADAKVWCMYFSKRLDRRGSYIDVFAIIRTLKGFSIGVLICLIVRI